eukprot:TRINITY_DN66091_c7_g8_i1.p1 TRINITY_DN66091_c7_g8~~TRINITY_DN66091_c7_g8_i1.p1  ORF type:complete len:982 (-),score=535.42 TRINITY_DN66091_c7_g8_i1:45-2867(-)
MAGWETATTSNDTNNNTPRSSSSVKPPSLPGAIESSNDIRATSVVDDSLMAPPPTRPPAQSISDPLIITEASTPSHSRSNTKNNVADAIKPNAKAAPSPPPSLPAELPPPPPPPTSASPADDGHHHAPANKKAVSLLVGKKNKEKFLDKLGMGRVELNKFQNAPKAYRMLGVYDDGHGGPPSKNKNTSDDADGSSHDKGKKKNDSSSSSSHSSSSSTSNLTASMRNKVGGALAALRENLHRRTASGASAKRSASVDNSHTDDLHAERQRAMTDVSAGGPEAALLKQAHDHHFHEQNQIKQLSEKDDSQYMGLSEQELRVKLRRLSMENTKWREQLTLLTHKVATLEQQQQESQKQQQEKNQQSRSSSSNNGDGESKSDRDVHRMTHTHPDEHHVARPFDHRHHHRGGSDGGSGPPSPTSSSRPSMTKAAAAAVAAGGGYGGNGGASAMASATMEKHRSEMLRDTRDYNLALFQNKALREDLHNLQGRRGWICKRRPFNRLFNKFKERYCILRGATLQYFDKLGVGAQARGTVELDQYEIPQLVQSTASMPSSLSSSSSLHRLAEDGNNDATTTRRHRKNTDDAHHSLAMRFTPKAEAKAADASLHPMDIQSSDGDRETEAWLAAIRFHLSLMTYLNTCDREGKPACPGVVHFLTDPLKKELSIDGSRVDGSSSSVVQFALGTFNSRLCKSRRLEAIVIRNTPLQDAAVEMIAELIKHNSAMRRVELVGCQVGPNGGLALARALRSNSLLKDVVLDDNRLQDSGVLALASAVPDHPALRTLSVAHNDISEDGATALVKSLGKLHPDGRPIFQFPVFNASWNRIGDAGCKAATALAMDNTSVRRLLLAGNGITDVGCAHLAELIKSPECEVREIDLRSNKITDDGVRVLLSALNKHQHATRTLHVHLSDNNDVSLAALDTSATAARTHVRLEVLSLTSQPYD